MICNVWKCFISCVLIPLVNPTEIFAIYIMESKPPGGQEMNNIAASKAIDKTGVAWCKRTDTTDSVKAGSNVGVN